MAGIGRVAGRNLGGAVGLLGIAILAAACAGSARANPSAAGAAASAPRQAVTVPAGIQGTWRSFVNGTPHDDGLWLLQFGSSGVQLHDPATADGSLEDLAAVSIDGSTIAFGPSALCPGSGTGAVGTYTWKLAPNGLLDFSVVTDSCSDRKAALTTGDWIKN